MQISHQHLNRFFTQPLKLETITAALNQMGVEVERIQEEEGDHILHLEITPNRPDCLSYHGLAREIAAGLRQPELLQASTEPSFPKAPEFDISIQLKNPKDCSIYHLRKISNVSIQKSPSSLERILSHSGFACFNHVVDAINLNMIETGQPMHAIDADKIKGRVVVRNAKSGEKVLGLDGKTHTLDERDIVISDAAENPIAIAGIMGAKYAEITPQTQNVYIECAYFDPITIRKTRRKLGLSTESAHRFALGVDPGKNLLQSLDRLTQQILKYNGTLQGTASLNQHDAAKRTITLNYQTLDQYLNTTLDRKRIHSILTSLGFEIEAESSDHLRVQVPSWRQHDVKFDVCLIEEIAKVSDYNQLPTHPPIVQIKSKEKNQWLQFKRLSENFFTQQGFYQCVNFGFICEADLAAFSPSKTLLQQCVVIERPLNQNYTLLRNTQLIGLLKNFNSNLDRGETQIKLFEIGRIFETSKKAVSESRAISGLLYGPHRRHYWKEPSKTLDFYDLKSIVLQFLSDCTRHDPSQFQITAHDLSWYAPETSCQITLNGTPLGHLGQLQSTAIHKKATDPLFAFEFNLDALIQVRDPQIPVYREPSRYPSIMKDLALICDVGFESEQIIQTIRSVGKDLIHGIRLFDVYQGKPISKGQESLAYSIEFNAKNRSLTHEEVNELLHTMVQRLNQDHGLTVRDLKS